MYHKKAMLKKWKADLQAIKEEKRQKHREKKTNNKHNIPDDTAIFMTKKNMYHKKNGVWKQKYSMNTFSFLGESPHNSCS
ncbi:hypothetical protein [Bacillus mycoides]|uniref:hypothetical protein n=1 Tax=Bacillus mycoides TaxID=1405 RepID=UPI001C010FC5|nr:hypothetical protein [Bacillus mycoides]MED1384297.1 hypothetical protein [Bacillus mycoides]QWI47179.1 hypothetical protein EXW55_30460 [Bacillus mycoides]